MATASETALQSCFRCGLQQPKLRRCSKCKTVWYCGPDCQKKDWVAGHKINCGKKVVEDEDDQKGKEEKVEEICDKVQVCFRREGLLFCGLNLRVTALVCSGLKSTPRQIFSCEMQL